MSTKKSETRIIFIEMAKILIYTKDENKRMQTKIDEHINIILMEVFTWTLTNMLEVR